MFAACFLSDLFMFCLSVGVRFCRYDERKIRFRTLIKKTCKNFSKVARRQVNDLNHRSRGHRPRSLDQQTFCPVGAIQIMPRSIIYAAIVAHPKCSHDVFDQRASTVVNAKDPRTAVGLSITDPAKPAM